MKIERTEEGVNVTIGEEVVFIPKVNPTYFEHGLTLREKGIPVRDSWPGLPKDTYPLIYKVLELIEEE